MTSHGKTWRLAGLLLAFGLLASPVRAQGPKSGPAAERKADKEKLRGQILDKLRSERMWELTQALKLDEATAAKLFPLLSKFDDDERALGKERGPLVRELRDSLAGGNPDPNRTNALVDHLLSIRARRQALETDKLNAVRKVLTPVQMGKLLLVAPKIDEGFRERIRTAVQAARRGGDLGRAPGADVDWP
jgi:Spy/CpxP family protein refolding chaperone